MHDTVSAAGWHGVHVPPASAHGDYSHGEDWPTAMVMVHMHAASREGPTNC